MSDRNGQFEKQAGPFLGQAAKAVAAGIGNVLRSRVGANVAGSLLNSGVMSSAEAGMSDARGAELLPFVHAYHEAEKGNSAPAVNAAIAALFGPVSGGGIRRMAQQGKLTQLAARQSRFDKGISKLDQDLALMRSKRQTPAIKNEILAKEQRRAALEATNRNIASEIAKREYGTLDKSLSALGAGLGGVTYGKILAGSQTARNEAETARIRAQQGYDKALAESQIAANEAQAELARKQLSKLNEPAGSDVNITGTLTTNSPGVEQGLNAVADAAAKAQKEEPKANNPTVPQKVDTTVTVKNNWMPWVAGAIGAGALGLGGAALYRYLTSRDRGQGAKIQYRMEGKKGDPWSEALVDVPIRTPRLSPKIKDTLESGLKRQVSKNIKYMSTKRDPNTGKRISYEDWQRLYGEEEEPSAEKTPDNEYTDKLNKKYEKAASVLDVEDKTKVEKGALSNKYKENNGSWSEAGTTTKVAANREWAEGGGAILNALLSGGVGAMVGREIAQKNGKNSLYGMLLGGAAGLAPSVIGSMLGHAVGDRTPAAQLKHDDKGAGPEFLVPGYAMYNSARRNPRAIQMLTPALQEAYKGEDEDEDDWEDDDFDKEAAAPQTAPPSNQPQAQPGPQPQTPLPGGGAPVTPSTTGPSQGPGDAANARPADPSANKALSAINSIGGMLGVQVNPSATQKQMA